MSATPIFAVEDVYARSGVHANVNFSQDNRLLVKTNLFDSPDYDRESFLKFDLSSLQLSDITPDKRVELVLPTRGSVGADTETSRFVVDRIGDDSWREDTLNWSNRPQSGRTLSTFFGVGEGETIRVDVTDAVRGELSTGREAWADANGVLSVRLSALDDGPERFLKIGSSELNNPAYRPALVVNDIPPGVGPGNGETIIALGNGRFRLVLPADGDYHVGPFGSTPIDNAELLVGGMGQRQASVGFTVPQFDGTISGGGVRVVQTGGGTLQSLSTNPRLGYPQGLQATLAMNPNWQEAGDSVGNVGDGVPQLTQLLENPPPNVQFQNVWPEAEASAQIRGLNIDPEAGPSRVVLNLSGPGGVGPDGPYTGPDGVVRDDRGAWIFASSESAGASIEPPDGFGIQPLLFIDFEPPPPPVLTLSSEFEIAYESPGQPIEVLVTADRPFDSPTELGFVYSGTAGPEDYTLGVAAFAAGSAETTVRLRALQDGVEEPDETLTILPAGSDLYSSDGVGLTVTISDVDPESIAQPPANLMAAVAGPDQVNLTWERVTAAGFFLVHRGNTADFTADVGSIVGATESTDFVDRSAGVAGEVYYRVSATTGDVLGDATPSVAVDLAVTSNEVLVEVENLLVIPGADTFLIEWTDPLLSETGFIIERSADGGAPVEVGRTDTNVTSFVDESPLDPEVDYTYSVSAQRGSRGGPRQSSPFPDRLGTPFNNGVRDNLGGLDDGDGNQPLTDRDGFWDTRDPDDLLIIGFSGHLQSGNFNENDPDNDDPVTDRARYSTEGPIWNVPFQSGTYQIGVDLNAIAGTNVTLFPADPGEAAVLSISLAGDGVLGARNPNEGDRRVAGGTGETPTLEDRTGAVNFAIDAILNHGVRNIGVFGYSFGGGSVDLFFDALVQRATTGPEASTNLISLLQNGALGLDPFLDAVTFSWTATIDAVQIGAYSRLNDPDRANATGTFTGEEDTPHGEVDGVGAGRKIGSDYHFNVFQSVTDSNGALNRFLPGDDVPYRVVSGRSLRPGDDPNGSWLDSGRTADRLVEIDVDTLEGHGNIPRLIGDVADPFPVDGLNHVNDPPGSGIAENGRVQDLVIASLIESGALFR